FSKNGHCWWVKSGVQAIAIISPKTSAETLIISSAYKSFRSTEISQKVKGSSRSRSMFWCCVLEFL
ncbi:MAG: hypothetical protein ACHBN1_37455, partial [Heteroscytonema crispum UTEX LB 1556]